MIDPHGTGDVSAAVLDPLTGIENDIRLGEFGRFGEQRGLRIVGGHKIGGHEKIESEQYECLHGYSEYLFPMLYKCVSVRRRTQKS